MWYDILQFWTRDRVINFLLRTVHQDLEGKIHLPDRPGSEPGASNQRDVRSSHLGVEMNPAAIKDGEGLESIAASISKCLVQLQTLLIDGKPSEGWKSEGLKSLREEVVQKLSFRCALWALIWTHKNV